MLVDEYEPCLPPTFVEGFHEKASVLRTVYQRLGNTAIIVSKLSIGGGALGDLFGPCSKVDALAVVRQAVRHGVTLIDTGYWYGQARSEQRIGEAIRSLPRQAFYLSLSVGRYELDFQRTDEYRGVKLLKAIEDSLRRLGVKHVDIIQLQVHDFDFAPEDETILHESLPTLNNLKKAGVTGAIALGAYSLTKLLSLLRRSPVSVDAVFVYGRGTLNDGTLGQYMAEFQKLGIGVVNGSPLSAGLLSEKGPASWHVAPATVVDACRAAVRYSQEKGVGVGRLAVSYAADFPGCHTTLVGVESSAQLMENLEAVWQPADPLERRVRARIIRRYLEPLDNHHWEKADVRKYWQRQQQTGRPILKHKHRAHWRE